MVIRYPTESSNHDQQTDQCTSETFTSSDNSESNLDDFDHGVENDSNKQPASMTTNYSFSNRTAGVLTSTSLTNNPFAVKTTTATKSIADSTDNKEGRPIVAPATFTPNRFFTGAEQARGNCSSSSFKLKPAVLANPFAKCDSVSEKKNDCPGEVSTSKEIDWSDDSAQESNSVLGACSTFATGGHISSSFACSAATTNSTTTSIVNTNNNASNRHSYQSENNHNMTTLSSLTHLTTPSTSLVPPVSIPSEATGNINFVFGQKMNERVRVKSGSSNAQNSTSPTANGTTLPTFGHSPDQREQEEEKIANGEPAKSKSLHESAQEYESRKVKRTYDEVLVVTGEEEESNVLQINCKLFAFDKTTSSWMERGRGLLRLNDKEEESASHQNEGALQSRLVMRTQGSLRVVLNTKVWRGMTIERPSPKSVQITAVDGDGVKVFLIMASPKDAEQLHSAINWRVTTLKTMEEQLPHQRFVSGACPKASGSVNEEASNCQPSTTTSDDSSSSPKRRRVMGPDQQLDDSDSNEFGTNIQDTSIDSTSRNKSNTFEADSGNLSSSSL